jgi:hypothetical protein
MRRRLELMLLISKLTMIPRIYERLLMRAYNTESLPRDPVVFQVVIVFTGSISARLAVSVSVVGLPACRCRACQRPVVFVFAVAFTICSTLTLQHVVRPWREDVETATLKAARQLSVR